MPESEPSKGGAYALLTATGRYSDPTLGRLRAPTRDAEELAKVLRNPAIGGFTVSTLVDKPVLRVVLLVVYSIMLIFCVARVWKHRQPHIPFLTKAA